MALALCVVAQGRAATPLACGPLLPQGLLGRTLPAEGDWAELHLAFLGASELSDAYRGQSFVACGSEYMAILDAKSVVRDVVALPAHSRQTPESMGRCERNGEKTKYEILAVLDNSDPAQDRLPVKFARAIDVDAGRFLPISSQGLLCSREDIFTVDGGK